MPPPTLDSPAGYISRRWLDAARLEGFAAEVRVNRIRLAAILVFYARHLIDVYVARIPAAMGQYHTVVTGIVIAWTAMAVVLHWRLSRRQFGARTKFVTVGWDLLMVTAIAVAAGGPKTPLILLYFVLIATAPLRVSLPLVWFASIGAAVAYLLLLAYYAWYLIGFDKYYATPELQIPRSHEVIFVLSLVVCGVLAGQMVRQARRLAAGSPVSLSGERAEA